ncbi:MAG: hypothetical protein AAFX94_12485 [Myxococcota bacterium]
MFAKLSRENVGLVVAVAALLVSAASFYATYLQSVAATRQVKAATWPYLQVEHGNIEDGVRAIAYSLRNVGVGPLFLRTFELDDEGRRLTGPKDLIDACCSESDVVKALSTSTVSSVAAPQIVPARDSIQLFRSLRTDENADAWDRLDRARWRINYRACYCSILDECWIVEKSSKPRPVHRCDAPSNPNAYWR